VIVHELTKLAARKLGQAQERARRVLAEATNLLQTAADWHTQEDSPGESQSHQAIRDIAAATKLCKRGAFLDLIEAERLARRGIETAREAIARQQGALRRRLESSLNESTQLFDQVRPLARIHARKGLSEVEDTWRAINRHPSSYDGFTVALRKLNQLKALLGQVAAEGEKKYAKDRCICAAIGGVGGAVVGAAVGFLIGTLLGAILLLVLVIPIAIIVAMSGASDALAEQISLWLCMICSGAGTALGAVIGAVNVGSTAMKLVQRE